MGTPKKPRKHYIPKAKRTDIISFIFNGSEPLDTSTRTSILTAVHAAVVSIDRVANDKSAWHTLTNALNIAQILCEEAGNREIGLNVIFAAQNAMIDAAEGFNAGEQLKFAEGGLAAVNEAVDLLEQLLETVSKLQYSRAAGESTRRNAVRNVVRVKRGKVTKRFALEAA